MKALLLILILLLACSTATEDNSTEGGEAGETRTD